MEMALQQDLREDEKHLLEEIQRDIPLVTHPFEYIGNRCGISEEGVIKKLECFTEQGIIRELSVIFNAVGLGYKSTLVAVKTAEHAIDTLSERINRHPGVSHNYLRENQYNIWFTLTLKQDCDFSGELKKLFDGIHPVEYLVLPSLKTFKIGVHLPFTDKKHVQSDHAMFQPKKEVKLSELDKRLVLCLQHGLPIVAMPWEKIAGELKIDEQTLFYRIHRLKEAGAIKRISAVLRHRRVGFRANGMACFQVPQHRIDTAGRCLARYPEVSHCYQRQTCPEWRYSLYAMVHKKQKEDCVSIIDEMARKIRCNDFLVLFSVKEFKKARVKYFLEQLEE